MFAQCSPPIPDRNPRTAKVDTHLSYLVCINVDGPASSAAGTAAAALGSGIFSCNFAMAFRKAGRNNWWQDMKNPSSGRLRCQPSQFPLLRIFSRRAFKIFVSHTFILALLSAGHGHAAGRRNAAHFHGIQQQVHVREGLLL